MRSLLSWLLVLSALLLDPTGAFAQVHLDAESIVSLPWGSGDGTLGRRDAHESDPEGPQSFALAPDGSLYVLDQVQARIVQLSSSGEWLGTLSLPSATATTLDLLPDGRLVVLDRLVRRSLLVVDPVLGVVAEHPVPGPKIEHSGLVTALFVRADGVWLEVDHAFSVRVLDEQARPCTRATIPGRPSQAGPASLLAALDGRGGARVAWLSGSGRVMRAAVLDPVTNLLRLVWVEDLPDGRTWVIGHAASGNGDEQFVLRLFAPTGEELLRETVPYPGAEWYQQRHFRLYPDGTLVQMLFDDQGVHFVAWRRP